MHLANEMLRQLHVKHEVKQLCDIDAAVFVTLFEGLSAESIPGMSLYKLNIITIPVVVELTGLIYVYIFLN